MQSTQQNALTLTTIQLSGAISLPVLMAGYFVGINYSSSTGLMQIIFANILLCIAACTYVQVALQHKEITVQIARRFFGKQGGLICSVGMLTIMLGWAVIQLHYMTAAIQALLNLRLVYAPLLYSAITSAFFYVIMMNGLNSFDKLNRILFPIMIALMVFSLIGCKNNYISHPTATLPVFFGVIIILMTASGMLYDLPTYYHNAASTKDARISLLILFMIILPIVQILGLALAKMQLTSDLSGFEMTKIFSSFNNIGLLFLIISSFLTNCLNIYSSVVVIKQFVNVSYKKVLMLVCLLCAASGFISLDHSLISLLEGMNILSEIMLCLILVYVVFYGVNLSSINPKHTKIHSQLLYSVLIIVILSRYLPFSPTNDYFINSALLSIFVMTLYCGLRRYL